MEWLSPAPVGTLMRQNAGVLVCNQEGLSTDHYKADIGVHILFTGACNPTNPMARLLVFYSWASGRTEMQADGRYKMLKLRFIRTRARPRRGSERLEAVSAPTSASGVLFGKACCGAGASPTASHAVLRSIVLDLFAAAHVRSIRSAKTALGDLLHAAPMTASGAAMRYRAHAASKGAPAVVAKRREAEGRVGVPCGHVPRRRVGSKSDGPAQQTALSRPWRDTPISRLRPRELPFVPSAA